METIEKKKISSLYMLQVDKDGNCAYCRKIHNEKAYFAFLDKYKLTGSKLTKKQMSILDDIGERVEGDSLYWFWEGYLASKRHGN